MLNPIPDNVDLDRRSFTPYSERYQNEINEIRNRPGQWFAVATFPTITAASYARRRLAVTTEGFEWRSRTINGKPTLAAMYPHQHTEDHSAAEQQPNTITP